MPSTVYIETTVPSAHVSSRTDPGSLHRREVTREWWRDQLTKYDVWVSDAVLLELERGLAISCVHEVDFLLTWNIRHLANPNKLDHLTVINRRMGLLTPQIVTPEMLWLE